MRYPNVHYRVHNSQPLDRIQSPYSHTNQQLTLLTLKEIYSAECEGGETCVFVCAPQTDICYKYMYMCVYIYI
jgi:hypothetical protein